MKEYGIIGYPVGHSKSEEFFNEKFQNEGIAAVYRKFDFPSLKPLRRFLLAHPHLQGFNVTSPYKRAIIPYLHEMDSEAMAIAAVNVVVVKRSWWRGPLLYGYNTDVVGFYQSIEPLLRNQNKGGALILGTGGAALAVARAFNKLRVKYLMVSRTPKGPQQIGYSDITAELLAKYPIVVNCTPMGMYPNADKFPPFPYELIHEGMLCYDLIYAPEQTRFLQLAAERGAIIKNGIDMLLLQAVENWRIWSREI